MGASASVRAKVRLVDAAPHHVVVWAVVLGCVFAGVSLIALAYTAETLEARGFRATLACWLTLPYVVAGLIAWHRRPESKLGVLMVTAGFVTFASFLNWSANDLLYTFGSLTQFLPPALFLHVFLAFPAGQLGSRMERVVVAGAYAVAAIKVPRLLLGEDSHQHVLGLTMTPTAVSHMRMVQLTAMSVLLVAGTILLLRRRDRPGRPVRASLGYLIDSFSVALTLIALLYAVQIFGWVGVIEPVRWAAFGMVGLAPIVFLAGLLRARLGRASVGGLIVELGVNPGPSELQCTAQGRAGPALLVWRLRKWGIDHVLFGSDYFRYDYENGKTPQATLRTLRRYPFTQRELDRILANNGSEWLGTAAR